MDYHNRRNRRGRPRTRPAMPPHVKLPQKQSLLNTIYNFLIMSSLISIVYVMLGHHCNVCSKKYDLHNITRNISDIMHNINDMKNSYCEMEKTIQRFSMELPKIEGQIEVLEVLANNMKKDDYIWKPRKHSSLSKVPIVLKNKPEKSPRKSSEINNMTTVPT